MGKARKFVFVLGAGASLAAGATATIQYGSRIPIPTQQNFWPTLLRFSTGEGRQKLHQFLFRYFLGYERVPARLSLSERAEALRHIDVEEVFTFVSERARAPSTLPQAKKEMAVVWRLLVESVARTFKHFPPNPSTRATYHQFCTAHVKTRDVVVSFNYDTVFESSLIKGRDWHYAGIEEKLGLPILKPHGSVNWERRTDGSIVRNDDVLLPVVVAPTHLKFVAYAGSRNAEAVDEHQSMGYLDQSHSIEKVWAEMEKHMKRARAIVFIGYSFPAADLYFSSVLRSVLASRLANPDIVVVNPDAVNIASRITRRFSIDRVLKYFDLSQYAASTRQKVINQLERRDF